MDFGLVGLGLKQAGVELPNLSGVGLVNSIPGVSLGAAKDDAMHKYGEIRKAGQILSGNPLGALAAELIFPPATAHGTIESEMKRGGFK